MHTKSHPDPEPVKVVDKPEKLFEKISTAESQGSSSTLPRATSLPEKLFIIQDINFDLPFEHSLFKTKSDSFGDEIVL